MLASKLSSRHQPFLKRVCFPPPFKCKSLCNKEEAGSSTGSRVHSHAAAEGLNPWSGEWCYRETLKSLVRMREGGKAVEVLESTLAIFAFTIRRPRDEIDKGKVLYRWGDMTSSGSWILLAVSLRNAACCSTCQRCTCASILSQYVLVFLFGFIFLTNLNYKSESFGIVTSGYAK